jgi:hypothetical protein
MRCGAGMRSTRLAFLAVALGSALLGWSTAGVTAVAGNLSKSSDAPDVGHHHDHQHHGWRGV